MSKAIKLIQNVQSHRIKMLGLGLLLSLSTGLSNMTLWVDSLDPKPNRTVSFWRPEQAALSHYTLKNYWNHSIPFQRVTVLALSGTTHIAYMSFVLVPSDTFRLHSHWAIVHKHIHPTESSVFDQREHSALCWSTAHFPLRWHSWKRRVAAKNGCSFTHTGTQRGRDA